MYDSTEKGWDLFLLRIMQYKLAGFADTQEYEDGCLTFMPAVLELSVPCSAYTAARSPRFNLRFNQMSPCTYVQCFRRLCSWTRPSVYFWKHTGVQTRGQPLTSWSTRAHSFRRLVLF